MKAISVIDGPWINVFGWLTAPACLPVISVPGAEESARAPCTFSGASDVTLHDEIAQGVVDVPFAIRKKALWRAHARPAKPRFSPQRWAANLSNIARFLARISGLPVYQVRRHCRSPGSLNPLASVMAGMKRIPCCCPARFPARYRHRPLLRTICMPPR